MSSPAPKRAAKNQRPTEIIPAAAPVSVADEAVVSRNVEIETEEIAALAYSYWEARGCQAGSAEDDWLRAEQQLRAGG
jgi:hypothetical protein